MRILSLAALACLAAAAAGADELSDRLCPVLADVAAAAAADAMIPEAAQADLVISVGAAWDYDGEALRTVLAEADASATAACPDARAAVLDAVGKESLEAAMR